MKYIYHLRKDTQHDDVFVDHEVVLSNEDLHYLYYHIPNEDLLIQSDKRLIQE